MGALQRGETGVNNDGQERHYHLGVEMLEGPASARFILILVIALLCYPGEFMPSVLFCEQILSSNQISAKQNYSFGNASGFIPVKSVCMNSLVEIESGTLHLDSQYQLSLV